MKIVTDAYNGSVSFYLADPADPLAQTLGEHLPRAVSSRSPTCRPIFGGTSGIRKTCSAMQAQMYATYHMTNPVVFYNKEDQWQWPVLESGQNSEPMQPYYTMMTLPGETKTEFIQMLPFTPRAKDNLAAWMAARSDAEHYGQLVVFQFPKQKIVYGPRQIVGPHQSGPGDFAADHAVEPAGFAGHLGHAPRHSHRRVAASTCGRSICGRRKAASRS